MRKVFWSFDAKSDLVEIISYIKEFSGAKIAREIYSRILEKVDKCGSHPESYRIVPELQDIGVLDLREIIESPWRIFFRFDEQEIRILSILDGRRIIEEILYRKMIEGKLK